jgi:hypothetical protein
MRRGQLGLDAAAESLPVLELKIIEQQVPFTAIFTIIVNHSGPKQNVRIEKICCVFPPLVVPKMQLNKPGSVEVTITVSCWSIGNFVGERSLVVLRDPSLPPRKVRTDVAKLSPHHIQDAHRLRRRYALFNLIGLGCEVVKNV